ncbi:MAG: HRDC domain-containing protein [Pirellulaceae bacterium]|nr:HRDC domain-containing protein [Pirellulaceae bacterium]
MPYKFFIVPIQDGGRAEAELNAFLRGHTVLSVARHWVDQGPTSFWSFCVDYVESAPTAGSAPRGGRQRERVDYRAKLGDERFQLYLKLSDLRKELAQADGVPLYNIFNNEQMSQMIERQARSKADLEAIAGVGDARIEKYGPRFVELLAELWSAKGETDGKPA